MFGMRDMGWKLYFVIIAVPFIYATQVDKLVLYQRINDPDSTSNVLWSSLSSTSMECSTLCANDEKCHTFKFSPIAKTCNAYEVLHDAGRALGIPNTMSGSAPVDVLYTQIGPKKWECPANWITLGESCYWFEQTYKQWHAAKSDCSARSGYLAEIGSAEESALISDYIQRTFPYTHEDIYIGLSLSNGVWIWSTSGQQVVYSNWVPGQPDWDSQGCGCISWGYYETTQWDNLECDYSKYYVCEQSPSLVI